MTIRVLALFVLSCLFSATVSAGTIYVDNVAGVDTADGRAPVANSQFSGPVRTIARGLALVRPGDTVNVANTGIPYHESLSLVGSRVSGIALDPFTLRGNGAVVDGSQLLPPEGWSRVAAGLWKITPWKKGLALLLRDGAPLPQVAAPADRPLPELAPGEWCLWKGSIYLALEPVAVPADQALAFAVHDVGLTVFNVHDVIVTGLTFRHFRIDGVNAHDQCRRVVLDRVVSTGNARAGVTVAGSSRVVARECDLLGNGQSVRIEEVGYLEVKESKVDTPPEGRPE